MATYDYELTLTFKLSTFDQPIHPAFAMRLNQLFGDWNDGRYPFDVEMVQNGIDRCFKQAAFMAVQCDMQEKFGNEMVETSPNSSEARWYTEAKKVDTRKMVPFFRDEPHVRIERVHDEQ